MDFDTATLTAYLAASTPTTKAEAVRDSLGSGTLTVEIFDGATLCFQGTFSGPLVALNGTLGKVVTVVGVVAVAGTPNAATWTCRVRNADGSRYMVGSFGPGGRFNWSRGALKVGQGAKLNILISVSQQTQYGLIYPSNNVSGSDIGLDWTGANMVPIHSHTAIWKIKFVQQTGYYAVSWHCRADNSFAGGWDYVGAHPYPCDGTYDSDGHALVYGSGFTTHSFEIVPVGGTDYIASAGGSSLTVVKDVWYSQARTVELINDGVDMRFRYWPDIDNNPSYVIEQVFPVAGSAMSSPIVLSGNPLKFRIGASPWTPSGSANSESLSGTIRFLLQYSRALSLAEVQSKLALTSDDTTDPDIWYSNLNPKPDDVADKSGQGHHPAFANANLPTLYTG